ncbi:MAG TPA: hypothetical protein VFB27_08920, partial [Opitutaceae bacterium]|nr:hypothetical protein [Opitutaceae bacterium]
AGLLAGRLAADVPVGMRGVTTAGVGLAFLPLAAWQNALWGFQSQVYFVLIFSLLAFFWLGLDRPKPAQLVMGLTAGLAAIFSMGPGELVPFALLGLAIMRAIEKRQLTDLGRRGMWPIVLLSAIVLAVMPWQRTSPQNCSPAQFLSALNLALSWPHVDQPWAAVVLNVPLLWAVISRLLRRRRAGTGEDLIILMGGWALLNAVAIAWARGGDEEFGASWLPSRYIDLLILLPLANAWLAVMLLTTAAERWRRSARLLVAAWMVFLLIGWLGTSLQTWHDILQLRIRDRFAPVRLAQKFYATGDPRTYLGQPRLNTPHPRLDLVWHVLHDPRLQGALPPSFQPKQPLGPLSGAVRPLLEWPVFPGR